MKSVGLTREEQRAAFKNARESIVEDVEAGKIDAHTHHDNLPDGEVVRILADAYEGCLEWDP